MLLRDPSDVENSDRDEIIDLDDMDPENADLEIEENDDVAMEDGAVAAGEMMEDPLRDDSTVTFCGHNEPVFSIAFNPIDSSVVATGGQDDKAFVWNSFDGSLIFECTGHKNTVDRVEFSSDGRMLATGDLSGFIQVWSLSEKKSIWSFEVGELEMLKWHFGASVLFAGDADGIVWYWKIPSGDCKTLSFPGWAASSCCLLPGGSELAVSYANGDIRTWDLKSGTMKHSTSEDPGKALIPSMDICLKQSRPLLAAGNIAGRVNIYNPTNLKLTGSFDLREKTGVDDLTVECVASCSSRPLVAAGTTSGHIFIIDTQNNQIRHKIDNNGASITQLKWQPDSPLLYSTDTDGVTALWDGRSGESTAKFYGHVQEIHNLAVAQQGVIFATCGEDTTAKVFVVSMNEPQQSGQ